MKLKGGSTHYFILSLFLLIIFSCSKDDEGVGSKSFIINGESYEINDAIIETYNYGGFDHAHFGYRFGLSDAPYIAKQFQDFNGDWYTYYEVDPLEASIVVEFEVFSYGNDKFKTGTFKFDTNGNGYQSTENYCQSFGVDILYVGYSLYEEYHALSGTVTVSGTEPNYTISYDILLDDYTGDKPDFKFSGVCNGGFRKVN